MHKLIIFSALIVCAIASWAPPSPANGHHHQQELQQHQHQPIAGHKGGVARAERTAGTVSRGHDSRRARGQLESVQHGGGTVYHDKEFRRTKKGQHSKHREGDKGKNHLRRAHSADKHFHH